MGGSYGLTAEPTLGFGYRAYLAKLLLNSHSRKTFTQLRFLHNFTHLRFLQNFYSLLNETRQQQTAASAPIIEIQKLLAPHADFNIFAPKKLILTICDRKDISFIFLWQSFSSSFVYRKSWVFVTSCILKMWSLPNYFKNSEVVEIREKPFDVCSRQELYRVLQSCDFQK